MGNNIDDLLVGLDNYLENYYDFIKAIGVDQFLAANYRFYKKDKPAFIISSGPSLNKNVSELKNIAGLGLIMSCDSAYKTLTTNGIKPDIIGSLERITLTYEAFFEKEQFPQDVVFAGPIVVRNETLKKFSDNKLLFLKAGNSISEWIDELTGHSKGLVWSGSSVSHMLYGLAVKLGCNPIILVGQDLAYSNDGFSHAKEAESIMEQVDVNNAEAYVLDSNGNKLPSNYRWKRFLHFFEKSCSRYKGNSHKFH